MSKHCTPFRYPGGKQKLTPFIHELLKENDLIGADYAEPYAGGAGVGIKLLLEGHVNHIHLNDSCYPIYACWHSMLTQSEEFCSRITNASLTVEEWKKRRAIVQDPKGHDEIEVGFSTFYLNRCNRSGVLSGGLIGGLAQSGEWKMDARFPKEELVRRITAIAEKADAITLRNWDAERFITKYLPTTPARTFVYCDPPYYEKAGRLYLDHYGTDDHARIAETIQTQLPRRWVVSYDNAEEILASYRERQSFVYDLQYNAREAYKGKEVFIFSDDVRIPASSSLEFINEALRKWREEPQQLELQPAVLA